MKIDFNQQVIGLDGKPFTDRDGGSTVNLSFLCTQALLGQYPNEKELSGDDKFKRYELASKIKDKEADISVEDIVLLKKLTGMFYATAVVGPVFLLLEGRAPSV